MDEPQVVLGAKREDDLYTIGTVSYVLHLIVAVGAVLPGFQPGVLLLIAAVVIDLLVREKAVDTWHASHFRFRLRSVLFAGVAYLVTLPLWFLFVIPGWIAWVIVSLWFLFRIVQGWSALSRRRAVEN